MSDLQQAINTSAAPGRRRRRRRTKALAIVLAPVLALLAAFQLQPTYIILKVPVAPNPVGYFWWEEERAQLAYADTSGVLYVHRRVGNAYPEPHGWRTADAALAYFESWLTARGWTRAPSGDDTPTLPESRFLDPASRRTFYRSTDREVRTHIAVWPTGGIGLRVVLVTSRPSWLWRLSRGFD